MLEHNNTYLQIAIDGPAGAGKSTVAKQVAKELDLLYLDTGAMYRAITLKALRQGVELSDEEAVSSLAMETEIELEHARGQRVFCDGEDVSRAIRSPEVSRNVSVVAAYPGVRQRLVTLQRQEAERCGVVMDGRDIGTHVLPQAQLKIFLTASPEERARRRWMELQKNGQELSLIEVTEDMIRRDRYDTGREVSPLEVADDALILDTTGLEIAEIVQKIVVLAQEVGR